MNSLRLKRPPALFIAGEEALSVSYVTGIPWYYGRTETRGAFHPMIDLTRLDEWQRARVTWALVFGYEYLASVGYDRAQLVEERNLKYWEGSWDS